MKPKGIPLITSILLLAGIGLLGLFFQGTLAYTQDGERVHLPLVLVGPPSVTPGPTVEPQETATTTPPPTSTPTDTPEPPTATPTPELGRAVVIDHTADASSLTQAELDVARQLSVFFNHASIGGNILDGMRDWAAQDPARYTISIRYGDGTQAGINEYGAGSNGRPLTKVDGFAAHVRDGHDLAMMKFCTGDVPCVNGDTSIETMWSRYRDMMVAQQAAHPDTALVWWTIPIISPNHAHAYCNEELAWFNNQVRAYVAERGGVLFDVAAIESQGGNCASSGHEAACPEYTSDGAHLNAVGGRRVASALWVLIGN